MLVCPTPSAYVGPEFRFFRTYNAHTNIAVAFSRGVLDGSIHDAADLARSVLAGTEQVQHGDPSERTHFMQHWRPAVGKEELEHIQRRCVEFLEDAEPESLSNGRVDSIEDRVCSCAFNPLGTAVGEQTTPGLRELSGRMPFSALQTSWEGE